MLFRDGEGATYCKVRLVWYNPHGQCLYLRTILYLHTAQDFLMLQRAHGRQAVGSSVITIANSLHPDVSPQ